MSLILRWRVPTRAVVTRWSGPSGMIAAVERDSNWPIATIIGPPGPTGPDAAPTQISQASPAGTWTLAHSLARIPMVQVFIGAGEEVIADVSSTTTHITVTHASPQSGFVLAF